MRRILLMALSGFMFLSVCSLSANAAPTKQQKKVAYAIKNLKLDANTSKTLQPLLMAYLTELKAVQKPYDDLKDKYKANIKNGSINDKVASALLTAKWDTAKKEVAIKEKYQKKFLEVISAKKVWYCFDLLNDKMSKIEGTSSKASADDDDE